MRRSRSHLLGALLLCACAHAPPMETVRGKRVGLGELTGDEDTRIALRQALEERFVLTEGPSAVLHLHGQVSTHSFDEPVLGSPLSPNQPAGMPLVYRRVQTLRLTLRMVDDATGEALAVSSYELTEKGPERPMSARASDELGIILSRRAVRLFIEEHRL